MQLSIYYIFIPTFALRNSAQQASEEWLLEPTIWIDIEKDRTGQSHSQKQIEHAAWTIFLAKLACEGAESNLHRCFREQCLQLGFAGCWSVHVARTSDPVEDLLVEAKEAENLAKLAVGR